MGCKLGKTIQNKIAISNKVLQEFLAELLGTFLLTVSSRQLSAFSRPNLTE